MQHTCRPATHPHINFFTRDRTRFFLEIKKTARPRVPDPMQDSGVQQVAASITGFTTDSKWIY